LGTVKMLEAISGQLRIKKFTGSELKQMRIERMEGKIKTPPTQSFSFYHFSASRRLGVENCFSIRSHHICSKSKAE
jgi:hypothetical protein